MSGRSSRSASAGSPGPEQPGGLVQPPAPASIPRADRVGERVRPGALRGVRRPPGQVVGVGRAALPATDLGPQQQRLPGGERVVGQVAEELGGGPVVPGRRRRAGRRQPGPGGRGRVRPEGGQGVGRPAGREQGLGQPRRTVSRAAAGTVPRAARSSHPTAAAGSVSARWVPMQVRPAPVGRVEVGGDLEAPVGLRVLAVRPQDDPVLPPGGRRPRFQLDLPGRPGHVHLHFTLGERRRVGSRNFGHRLLAGHPHDARDRHAHGGNDEPRPPAPQSDSHRYPPPPSRINQCPFYSGLRSTPHLPGSREASVVLVSGVQRKRIAFGHPADPNWSVAVGPRGTHAERPIRTVIATVRNRAERSRSNH